MRFPDDRRLESYGQNAGVRAKLTLCVPSGAQTPAVDRDLHEVGLAAD